MIATPGASAEMHALAEAIGRVPTPCQTGDPNRFFALDPGPAILLCGQCHAQPECRDLSRANGERHGVWAGEHLERRPGKQVAS